MSTIRTIPITVDIERPSGEKDFKVTQNTNVIFEITILKDGKTITISDTYDFLLSVRNPYQKTYFTPDFGVLTNGNVVTFTLATQQVDMVGSMQASVQIMDGDNRIDSLPFTFTVIADLANGVLENGEDKSLVQKLFYDVPRVVEEVRERKNVGLYDPDIQYKKGNIVGFNGDSFVAKEDIKGILPTGQPADLNWELLVRKGADGTGTVVRHREEFIATAGQTEFILENTYDQFMNRIDVTIDGVPQYSPDNFVEASANKIRFTTGLVVGNKVVVTYFSEAQPLSTDLETIVNSHTTEINNANSLLSEHSVKLAEYTKAELKSQIYSFKDAWDGWLAGEKFPIAFYGDSTVDGVNTTGWTANVLGVDSTSPYTFSKKLEEKLRMETGNNVLRIYNAGFSSNNAEHGIANIEAEFAGTSAYNDVKMVGIGFGINDRLLYNTVKQYRTGFKNNIKSMIEWCYEKNIQPFLLTTQAIVSTEVGEAYTSTYPLRTGRHIETIANEVKRELADEYELEIIDVNAFTEKFLLYSAHSANTIISDRLHFGNTGHLYESGLLFAHLNPYVMFVDKYKQIDYMNQTVVKGVPDNLMTMPATPSDGFKIYANYTKADSVDTLIFKAHVFIDSYGKLTLKAYKSDVSSLTYVKVNGVTTTLDVLEKTIGTLDLGLHTLEVWSGISSKVDFKGFIVS